MLNALPGKIALLAKSLIAFGVLGIVFGLFSVFLAVCAQNLLLAIAWGSFVCSGIFLWIEWIQFLRNGRLLVRSPNLWAISMAYISLFALGLLGFAGYIVWCSLTSEVVYNHGEPVSPSDWLKFVIVPLSLLPFAVCSFVFCFLLWRQTKRCLQTSNP